MLGLLECGSGSGVRIYRSRATDSEVVQGSGALPDAAHTAHIPSFIVATLVMSSLLSSTSHIPAYVFCPPLGTYK